MLRRNSQMLKYLKIIELCLVKCQKVLMQWLSLHLITAMPQHQFAMEMNKPVYCQKPLTHFVSEARAMRKIAEEKKISYTNGYSGSFIYDYKLATVLIQAGIIGKVHKVRAWSPKIGGMMVPN